LHEQQEKTHRAHIPGNLGDLVMDNLEETNHQLSSLLASLSACWSVISDFHFALNRRPLSKCRVLSCSDPSSLLECASGVWLHQAQ